uniref:PEP-CTERM protein-sorting domain-containing protein n=1 Tax=Rheinheimera sp. BAL341 TaxID=1708203 RepID=A0A486XQT1_9GAMM
MLKSILFAIAITALTAFTPVQNVQAGPILTQELLDLDGNSFGVLTVDLASADEFGDITGWLNFELFGYSPLVNVFFIASFDVDDIYAGLTFISFDVSDLDDIFAFQGFFEGGFGFLDVFTTDAQYIGATEFTLSNARLVSAPGTLLLILAAAGGLLLRRRQ